MKRRGLIFGFRGFDFGVRHALSLARTLPADDPTTEGDGPFVRAICLGRVGSVLVATIEGIGACDGFTFTGINGVFNDVTWNGTSWETTVGDVNGTTATLTVNCSGPPGGCEAWSIQLRSGAFAVFLASFNGPNCPFSDQFGTPISNTTNCDNPGIAGSGGTITLDTP